MTARIIAVIVLVGGLGFALIYSQIRQVPTSISGFVEADEIRLGSRLGGRIKQVFVEEGDRVERGQVLIELEPFDLEMRIAEAESQVAAKAAEVKKLESGNRPEEIAQAAAAVDNCNAIYQKLLAGARPEEKAEARAQLSLAEAQVGRTRRSWERLKTLSKPGGGSISPDELDRADEEYKVAQALYQTHSATLALIESGTRKEDLEAALANLNSAKQGLALAQAGFRNEDISQARAGLAAAQSQLDALKIQQRELKIIAPIEGTISASDFRPGDLLAPNAPVVSLLDHGRLWIRAYVPENKLDVQLGNQYFLTVDSFPGTRFVGEVTFIAPQAEFTPRNVQTATERSKQVFRIKVRIVEHAELLRPGMAADVWLDQAISPNERKP